jgi:hypothetical protein
MGCGNSKPKAKAPVTNPYAKIHKQLNKDEIKNKALCLEELTIPDILKASADDFEIGSYLQEGGMGKGEHIILQYLIILCYNTT